MKTIIEGNKERLKAYKYFECNKCGWAGKADKDEYKHYDNYQDSHYYVICPCCNNEVREVSVKRRDELRNREKQSRPDLIPFGGPFASYPPGAR